MTVAELLGRISSAELTEWRAFYRLERELQEEQAADRALDDDVESGTREVRNQLRGRD